MQDDVLYWLSWAGGLASIAAVITLINRAYVKVGRCLGWRYSDYIKRVVFYHSNSEGGVEEREYLAVQYVNSAASKRDIKNFLKQLQLLGKGVKVTEGTDGFWVHVDTLGQSASLGLGAGDVLAYDLGYKGFAKVHFDECESSERPESREGMKRLVKKAREDIVSENKKYPAGVRKSSFSNGYIEPFSP